MDEYQTEEEAVFVVEDVSRIIKEAVDAAIGGSAYQHSRVNQWTTSVVEQCLSQLSKHGKPCKYITTCTIMQKNGAGLQTASTCFWDNSTDDTKRQKKKDPYNCHATELESADFASVIGSCTVRWENKSMYCIVSVFGLAI